MLTGEAKSQRVRIADQQNKEFKHTSKYFNLLQEEQHIDEIPAIRQVLAESRKAVKLLHMIEGWMKASVDLGPGSKGTSNPAEILEIRHETMLPAVLLSRNL